MVSEIVKLRKEHRQALAVELKAKLKKLLLETPRGLRGLRDEDIWDSIFQVCRELDISEEESWGGENA